MAEAISRDVHELFGGASDSNPMARRPGRRKGEGDRNKTVKIKKPKGLHREVWNLMKQDDSNELPPVMPTDTYHSYKTMKMRVGLAKVTPWIWAPFSNSARKDGALFYHWVKTTERDAEYQFSKLNQSISGPSVTEKDYQLYLSDLPMTGSGPSWNYEETQHLLELAVRFELRFPIIQDRWNREKFPDRTIEDLKERYYSTQNAMNIAQTPADSEPPQLIVFDADHERRRKEQLLKLLAKTEAEVEEEENLLSELRKIEQRKKDRDRRAQELQRFITGEGGIGPPKRGRKRADLLKSTLTSTQLGALQSGLIDPSNEPSVDIDIQASMIKFPEFRSAGIYLRSSKLKLPATVAQRKINALEKLLEQYGVDFRVPIATDQLVNEYNNLRKELIVAYELRETLAACDIEVRTLVQQYNLEHPNQPLPFDISLGENIPTVEPVQPPSPRSTTSSTTQAAEPDSQTLVVPKRKAALQQVDWLKRLKNK